MTLNDLFKNTTYDDTLFSAEAKSAIESRIFMKSVRGSEVPYITCAIRDKEIKLTVLMIDKVTSRTAKAA